MCPRVLHLGTHPAHGGAILPPYFLQAPFGSFVTTPLGMGRKQNPTYTFSRHLSFAIPSPKGGVCQVGSSSFPGEFGVFGNLAETPGTWENPIYLPDTHL